MGNLGLIISVIIVGYIVYKLWKKIVLIIILVVALGFIFSVSKVNKIITVLTTDDVKTDSIEQVDIINDTINKEISPVSDEEIDKLGL
jgi:uncharacterized protein (DUF779 family)